MSLTPSPVAGSTFAGWSGACSGTGRLHRHGRPRPDRDRDVHGEQKPPPPPPPKPSNRFTIVSKKVSTGGIVTVRVRVPGRGKLSARGTYRTKLSKHRTRTVLFGSAAATPRVAGTPALTLKPSLAALKRLRSGGVIQLSVTITYTPTGGTARTGGAKVTVKLKRHAPKKHHH